MLIKSILRLRLKGEFSFLGMFLNYLWITYYRFQTFNDRIDIYGRYGYTSGGFDLLNVAWFGLGWFTWSIGAFIFIKITQSITILHSKEKKIQSYLYLILFFLHFNFFLGLFRGHHNNIYFIDFGNFFYDDIVFFIVCIIFYFFTYYYKALMR